MVSKKPFLQKKKRKIRKSTQTYLSDGIQDAVSTKKKRKIRNRLKTYLSDGIQETVSTKKEKKNKKSAQNSPFGWYPRSRFYKKRKEK